MLRDPFCDQGIIRRCDRKERETLEILLALLIGFTLDMLLGDPEWMPHPVRLIGRVISRLEKGIRRLFPSTPKGEFWGGLVLVLLTCILFTGMPILLLWLTGMAHPLLRLGLQVWIVYQLLAAKCLRNASMRVYCPLMAGDLQGARAAVGRIVGRDTDMLDEPGVVRAAVETVAENTSDGVIAPMLYFVLGGAPLLFLYKTINTMDSMLGYQNEKYLYFGRVAARLDDAANFFPARISGWIMVLAAFLCGQDGREAMHILRRDHDKHTSPNSAYPEAACAGALGLQLGGDSLYGGKVVHKPAIGDNKRDMEPEDIRRANGLLYAASFLSLVLCTAARIIWILVTKEQGTCF